MDGLAGQQGLDFNKRHEARKCSYTTTVELGTGNVLELSNQPDHHLNAMDEKRSHHDSKLT